MSKTGVGPVMKQVRKLNVQDNDVLVITFDPDTIVPDAFAEWLDQLTRAVSATGSANVSILAMRKGITLSCIGEDEMNNLGWVRGDAGLCDG